MLVWYFLIDINILLTGNIVEIYTLSFFLLFSFLTIVYVFYDILYLEIPEIIANAMSKYNFIAKANVNDFFETDKEVREELSSMLLK